MILSLQGCMAVGKTTALQYIANHAPYIHISYEMNAGVVGQIKRRGLDKNKFEDYIEIQKLWLRNEVMRWREAREYSCSLMDFGAEEIEFFTLNYPKTIGVNWDVEEALGAELDEVRICMPDRILFLDASDEILRRRKENDATRSRNSFEYHMQYLLPLKREWFFGKENVDVLCVDDFSAAEVGMRVKEWCDACIANHRA